jgi:prepilin-type N-terminal cleavage/methylation domain-containing protein
MFKSDGFSLLEILAALFILAVLMLGLNTSLIQSTKMARGAFYFYTASELATNIEEYLRTCKKPDAGHMARWQQQISSALPNGELNMHQDNELVEIRWGMKNAPCAHSKAGVDGCLLLRLGEPK